MIERGSYVIKHPEGWVKCCDYPPGAGTGVGLILEKTGDKTVLVQWPMGGRSEHFHSELIQTSIDGTPVTSYPFTVDSIVKVDMPICIPGLPGYIAEENRTRGTGVIKAVKGTGPGTVFSVQMYGGPLLDMKPEWISQWVVNASMRPKPWPEGSPIRFGSETIVSEMDLVPPGMEPCPEPKPTEAELKEAAHLKLSAWDIKPGYAFEHYKGGIYDVVAVSIMEDTLEPLVTYHSRKHKTTTTRTVKQFLGRVVYSVAGNTVGRPRFMRAPGHDAKPEPKRPESGSFAVVNQNQYPRKFTVLHTDEGKAREEAERLARKCPGDKFGVFRCIGDVRALPAPVDWTDPATGEVLERKEAKVFIDPFADTSFHRPKPTAPASSDPDDWDFDKDF